MVIGTDNIESTPGDAKGVRKNVDIMIHDSLRLEQ